jgi:hypothetical protein
MPEPIVFPLDLDEVREIWITRDVYGRLCGESRLFSQSDIGEALEGLRRARGDIQSLVAEVRHQAEQIARVRDLAGEIDVRAFRILGRDPVENGISAEEIYEAEMGRAVAGLILVALDGESAEQPGEAATS